MENSIRKNEQNGTSETPDSLIRKWLVVIAETFQFELPESSPGIPSLADAWVLALSDRSPQQLNAAFKKLLKSWKPEYGRKFPAPADLLSLIETVNSNAALEAAAIAWERVLDIRRIYWSVDIPGPSEKAIAQLSERVRTAARASGVFREFSAEEYESGALHTWARKRFIESFLAWGELEQDQFLLPDGEIKNLLADFSKTKALPASEVCFEDLHKRGLEYAKQIKESTEFRKPAPMKRIAHVTKPIEEQKEELRRRGYLQ